MKVLQAVVAVLGLLVVSIVIMSGLSLVYGITLSLIWGWIMVPTFHLPHLSIAQAIGVAVVVTYVTHVPPESPAPANETDSQKIQRAVHAVFKPIGRALGVLISAWITYRFFM